MSQIQVGYNALKNLKQGEIFVWVEDSASCPHTIYWLFELDGTGRSIRADFSLARKMVELPWGWQLLRRASNPGHGAWVQIDTLEKWVVDNINAPVYLNIIEEMKQTVSVFLE